ncbi:MAG: DNA polymerase III subunit delta [Ignavibacterium sp.]|nr:DNA polymerase III subunit delta [Ignavibacterium sp.]MCX8057683.1 DNA polymerase III subunit delta [Ignavibacteria bacterium]MDW8376127.1 DNA polymerase III subunit delta [Ignavibacteriales bacterium]
MSKSNLPSFVDIRSEIKSKKLKPIYFLFGEDLFGINRAVSDIKKIVEAQISSDFDNETFYCSDRDINLSDIVSVAKTFPFGDGKKLIIVKNAEELKYSDKDENFLTYIKNPADFTVLIFIYEGKISNLNSEPFKSLSKNQFLYEFSELRSDMLVKWVIEFVNDKNKRITKENAEFLVDIVGESRVLLENQIEKIVQYIGENEEITFKAIEELTTKLKTYTIFDLLNALDKKDKSNSLKIAYNLLDNSELGLLGIIAMLNKHFTTLLRIDELEKLKMTEEEKAKALGINKYFYSNFAKATRLYGLNQISRSLKAIYQADLRVKTTSLDDKTILTILIAEILSE